MTVNAYAKLNLMLSVGDKRADGFHNVESIMQSISLCDTLSLEKTADISLTCSQPHIPTGEKNLAYRAAAAFFKETGIKGGVKIDIEKRIPVGAGLGGGSANAAAVLKGLNALYGTALTEEELCALGSPLGSDVPFCIKGGTCHATGRGELLRVLPTARLYFVLLYGKRFLSTPYMYGRLDAMEASPIDHGGSLSLWEKGQAISSLRAGGNSFYPITVAEDESVAANIASLKAHGALYSSISGKGPTVFGVFDNEDSARATAKILGGTFCQSV